MSHPAALALYAQLREHCQPISLPWYPGSVRRWTCALSDGRVQIGHSPQIQQIRLILVDAALRSTGTDLQIGLWLGCASLVSSSRRNSKHRPPLSAHTLRQRVLQTPWRSTSRTCRLGCQRRHVPSLSVSVVGDRSPALCQHLMTEPADTPSRATQCEYIPTCRLRHWRLGFTETVTARDEIQRPAAEKKL